MSYATIEQADKYIESYYSSTDSLREAWDDLDDADKQVYLNRAERFIDQLPFRGRPVNKHKAFPRYPEKEYSLEQVKYATIELAINQLDTESAERIKMQQQGVKSYKLGDLSETFKDGLDTKIDESYLTVVYPFLQLWLGGGFDICPTRTRKFRGLI